MREYDTPPIDAARHGHAVDVAALLGGDADADVEEPKPDGSGATPLIVACQEGYTKVAIVLLSAGAAVDKANSEGVTPLFKACYTGLVEVVTMLNAIGCGCGGRSG